MRPFATMGAGARAGRRQALPALLAAVLAVGACGGAGDLVDDEAGSAAPSTPGMEAGGGTAAAPPAAPAAPGAGWTAEDSIQAVIQDSIQEARLMAARQASMDSYAGCMAKTKGADPEQRVILEAACQRARGAPARATPP